MAKIPRPLEMLQLGDRAECGLVDDLQHLRHRETSPLRAATADPVSSWSCHSGDHVLATPFLYALHILHKFALYGQVTSLVLQAFAAMT